MTLRRDFLTLAATTLAATTVSPLAAAAETPPPVAINRDTELLGCVERFASADREHNAAILRFGEDLDRLDLPTHQDQRRWEVFLAEQVRPTDAELDTMLHEIAAIPAYTAAGRAAKARVVQRWLGDGWDTTRVPREPWERVVWSLAQDALHAEEGA